MRINQQEDRRQAVWNVVRQRLVDAQRGPELRAGMGGANPPLSSQQLFSLMNYQCFPGDPGYKDLLCHRITGNLDIPALEKSLYEIVQRHEALRTTYHADGEGYITRIQPPCAMPLSVHDLRQVYRTDGDAAIEQFLGEVMRAPYNIELAPMLQAGLLRLSDDVYFLYLILLSITSDEWSIRILHRELEMFYRVFSKKTVATLPTPLNIQYGDYSAWQQLWSQEDIYRSHQSFWQQRLGSHPMLPSFPTLGGHVTGILDTAETFSLSAHLTEELICLSDREGCTLFMTLLASLFLLLHRYSRNSDLVIFSPVSGRTQRDTQCLIGRFTHSVVYQTQMSENISLRQWLHTVRQEVLSVSKYQDFPIWSLYREATDMIRLADLALNMVRFNYYRREEYTCLRLPDLSVEPYHLRQIFDRPGAIDVAIGITPNGLHGMVAYESRRFPSDFIERLTRTYIALLENIALTPDRKIDQLATIVE